MRDAIDVPRGVKVQRPGELEGLREVVHRAGRDASGLQAVDHVGPGAAGE